MEYVCDTNINIYFISFPGGGKSCMTNNFYAIVSIVKIVIDSVLFVGDSV